MAEYVLQDGDTHLDVARALIAKAGADAVDWSPRPDVPGGGVYVVRDEQALASFVQERQAARQAEAERIATAQKAADERDAKLDETGATPAELGMSPNLGTDPGSAQNSATPAPEGDVTLHRLTATDETAAAEEETDAAAETDAEETSEANPTTARRRAARSRAAELKAAADTEAKAPEEGK